MKEYRNGRKRKFYLREANNVYYFERITKACAFTIKAGTFDEVMEYINASGYKAI